MSCPKDCLIFHIFDDRSVAYCHNRMWECAVQYLGNRLSSLEFSQHRRMQKYTFPRFGGILSETQGIDKSGTFRTYILVFMHHCPQQDETRNFSSLPQPACLNVRRQLVLDHCPCWVERSLFASRTCVLYFFLVAKRDRIMVQVSAVVDKIHLPRHMLLLPDLKKKPSKKSVPQTSLQPQAEQPDGSMFPEEVSASSSSSSSISQHPQKFSALSPAAPHPQSTSSSPKKDSTSTQPASTAPSSSGQVASSRSSSRPALFGAIPDDKRVLLDWFDPYNDSDSESDSDDSDDSDSDNEDAAKKPVASNAAKSSAARKVRFFAVMYNF